MRGPRQHRRYTETRAAWLAAFRGTQPPCVLCGRPVDTSLPGRHPWGPTVEHTLPVRRILAIARDEAEALALACDTNLWELAHLHCQRRQGGRAAARTVRATRRATAQPAASREW